MDVQANTSLISSCEEKLFRLYFRWKKEGCQDAKSVVAMILVLKTYQRWFFVTIYGVV